MLPKNVLLLRFKLQVSLSLQAFVCAAVTRGECGSALAAGVNAMLSPKTAVKICQLQVCSLHFSFLFTGAGLRLRLLVAGMQVSLNV